jgi:hypothetical protein
MCKWNAFTIDTQSGVWKDGHLNNGKNFTTFAEIGLKNGFSRIEFSR